MRAVFFVSRINKSVQEVYKIGSKQKNTLGWNAVSV